jgi:hypothetical protein
VNGCRAPQPARRPPAAAAPAFVGRVLRFNAAERFVILQCERLPFAGQTLKLYRGKEPAGVLRANGPFRPPFVAADVVEGVPQQGDTVRRDPRGTAEPETGKDKP